MIEVRDLTAGYGKLEILQGLSISFSAERFSAVLGPNGSGKSTLMKAIMGVNRIFSGSVSLAGRELVGLPTEAISSLGIAYVPQRENIFDELTVLENLQLGARRLPGHEREGALNELVRALPHPQRPPEPGRQPAEWRRTPDAGHRHRLAEPTAADAAG